MALHGRHGVPHPIRTFDGTNWSGEATIAAPAAGHPRQVHGSAKPGSNEIVLIVDGPSSNYALVWDGSSWGNAQALRSSSGDTDINVAHEQQAGDALIVYGKSGSSEAHYRTWTTGWGAEQTTSMTGFDGNSLTLDADPLTDSMMLCVQGQDSDLGCAARDGSAWGSSTQLTDDTGEIKNQPSVFLWSHVLQRRSSAAVEPCDAVFAHRKKPVRVNPGFMSMGELVAVSSELEIRR